MRAAVKIAVTAAALTAAGALAVVYGFDQPQAATPTSDGVTLGGVTPTSGRPPASSPEERLLSRIEGTALEGMPRAGLYELAKQICTTIQAPGWNMQAVTSMVVDGLGGKAAKSEAVLLVGAATVEYCPHAV